MKSADTSLHHYIFPNIHEDGWKFISCMVVISLFLAILCFPLGCVSFLVAVWCFYSFRDPVRVTPVLSGAVIAPIDGIIISITKEKGPDVLNLQNKKFTRVCIYSSAFDSHVIRSPIKSQIKSLFYDRGKMFSRSRTKDDIYNEKLSLALRNSEGFDFALQQTTVFCSKRILSNIKINEETITGQKIGFLRFGGYIDLYLPEKTQPQVCIGQKMIAGETIMADIKSDAPRIEGEIR